MFKRISLLAILLALFAGQAWGITGTCYVDSTSSWDSLVVRIATASEPPDSVVGYKLWGSIVSNNIGRMVLWGTIVAADYTDPDSLMFGGLNAYQQHWFRWEILSYDTTLATGSRTTLKHTYTAIDSGYTKHWPNVTVAAFDSTNTQIKVKVNLPKIAPDSACYSWQLYVSRTNPPTASCWADSGTAINGTADTSAWIKNSDGAVSAAGNMYNGTQYYFYAVCSYWDTTGSNYSYSYTTPIDSIITKTVGQTIAEVADSTSYRNFQIIDTYFGADSAFKKIYMQYRVKGATTWITPVARAVWANRAVARDSTALGSVDTLWALAGGKSTTGYITTTGATEDLLAGTIYQVRVIATDSTSSDTSNTIEITTGTLPGYRAAYDSTDYPGHFGPNVYHFKTSWDKLNYTWTSPQIDITKYSRIRVSGAMFGRDNNHPGDSTKVWLRTSRPSLPNGWDCFDSSLVQLSNRPIADTLGFFKKYAITPSGRETVADSTVIDTIGAFIWFYMGVQDSNVASYGASTDTTTLDRHYLDIWVTGYEK